MFGTILYSFYGHGQASSSMMDLNSDLLDVCMASGQNEQGVFATFCHAVLYPAQTPSAFGQQFVHKRPLAGWHGIGEEQSLPCFVSSPPACWHVHHTMCSHSIRAVQHVCADGR